LPLANAPTLCRFEHWADRATAVALNQVLIEQFMASSGAPPEEIVLDFDVTDVPVHGRQGGAVFPRVLGPLLLSAALCILRRTAAGRLSAPSKIDAAKHRWAILALLTRRLCQAWPCVRIAARH
jgi:hypothetical protein